jgi:tRNA threonylcarbamoyladenosine biosynthesis protein TsaE
MAESAAPTPSAVLTQPELEAFGRSVGEAAAASAIPLPLLIALRGPLGAGKSVLARSIARGAGVEGSMPSPTYNLLFRYEGAADLAVYHLDLYRLEHPDDVWELGWQELGEGRQIVLVEWPERAESLVPADRWDVYLGFGETPGGTTAMTEDETVEADTMRTIVIERRGAAPDAPPLPGATSVGEASR